MTWLSSRWNSIALRSSLWTCCRSTTLSSWFSLFCSLSLISLLGSLLKIRMPCPLGWCSGSGMSLLRSTKTWAITQWSVRSNGLGLWGQLLMMLCREAFDATLSKFQEMDKKLNAETEPEGMEVAEDSSLSLWVVMMKQHQIHPQMLSRKANSEEL